MEKDIESVVCGSIIFNFMILKFMKKAHVQYVEEAHIQRSARDHSEAIPKRRVSLFRFYDHELMRIVRNLIVKKYLGADLMLPITYLLLF